MKIHASVFLALVAAAAHAGPRTSANYTIATDTADGGGKRTASASYTNDGSAGTVAGLSTVAAPAGTAKHGYIGQLYDVTGLVVNAGASSVNETATLQLAAWQFLDDTSRLAVNATTVSWLSVSGPITGISGAGLATAGTVYQNTAATVQGSLGGFTGPLNLTVLDTIADNFGTYAGDAVGDDWQVQYFGQPPNANAGPNADPTGGGQNNLFKYIAGLNPLDPNSRFTLRIAPVPGQPGQKNLTFSPRFTDRTYTIKAKSSLLTLGGWSAISASAPSDNGSERTITDLNASGPVKFYHVEITKP